MSFSFTQLFNLPLVSEHLEGIDIPFEGDLLSVNLHIQANLDRLNLPLGTIYQYFGSHCAAYTISRAKSVIRLLMPKTELLLFIPNDELYKSYGLSISYSKLPTMSSGNDYILPSVIDGLPVRVTDLESDVAQHQIYIENISTTLDSYALTSQLPDLSSYVTQSLLGTILDDYTLTSELPATSSEPESRELLTVDTLLESNAKYFSTIANLACTLPVNPAIGDVVTVSTGNFDTKVLQNTSQTILNLSTLTPVGVGTGIVLKPYSSIELIYTGLDLWVTGFRARAINNYTPISIESVATLKPYIPSLYEPAVLTYGTTVASVNNNELAAGNYVANGLLADIPTVRILVSFSSPIRLESFDFYGGQGNVGTGSANSGYKVDTIKVYSGSDLSSLLGTHNTTNINGNKQSFSIDTSGLAYTSYVFEFTRDGNGIGVLELDLFGKAQIGGELAV